MTEKKLKKLKKLQRELLFASPFKAGKLTAKIASLSVDGLKDKNQ